MEKKQLGNTGLWVTPVGMGVLTVGRTQLDLPLADGAQLIRYALERGINFFDTAEYYETYPYIAAAPFRDAVISSKSLARGAAGMSRAIEDCRRALGRDQIDIFLLHEIRTREDFQSRAGAWQALVDAKAKGRVRAIGLSTHHIDGAEIAAAMEGLDVLFALINYKSLGIRKGESPGCKEEMAEQLRRTAAQGKGVFTMKALGGGNLSGDYTKALDYVTALPGVNSIMLGMGTERDIDDAVNYTEHNLPRAYRPDVSKKQMFVDQGDCEGCGACIARCTSKAIAFNQQGSAKIDTAKCVKCGYCAYACPVRAIIML
ncbi:MAG: aldo/keto reductase [Clostridiales Family XIII bacterium]|jgi:aryl-alcohol dehydrogenase-like predicted oxidoreductase|nr:aldo/keto reductase [Clostridiales Family XIII bacterium]